MRKEVAHDLFSFVKTSDYSQIKSILYLCKKIAMTKQDLLDELIENYRTLVAQRYDYQALQEKFILDESVTEELTLKVKSYFLNYIYPTKSQREILNNAFQDLDKHIKNPQHILSLIGDAPGIIFKFGWQFPKAIKAGFQVLKSFRTATKFEKDLVTIAERKKVESPIDLNTFESIIADLSKEELEEFIEEFEELLTSLTDSSLLKKTTEILQDLVLKMKEQTHIYSVKEVAAMGIGIDILEQGYHLFDNMSSAEKREMIELIMKAERHFIEELQEKYSA